MPDPKRNHQQPTPRGGGIAVVGVILLAITITNVISPSEINDIWFMISGALVMYITSFMDDIRGLSIPTRLLIQSLAVIIGMQSLPPMQNYLITAIFPKWLYMTLIFLSWLWCINLYNFMDGIDGITAGQTICTSLFTIILVWLHKLPKELDYYAYSVIGSCAGFLRHNWHPAKIFIGDVGATSIGYIIGWLLIVLACYDLTYAPLCILPYYIGDSTITLLSRICKGKKIWERHTDHYFSQAVRKQNMPHNTVVWYIVLINILVFIVYIAMYMSYVPLYWSCLFAFLAISLLFRKFSSNRYEEQNY